MTAPLSLREEEMLAEIVKMYPVLYDKQVKGYKEKDVITHVWEDVAKALDFVENSTKAQSLFINLKKKYQRKRRELKESQSGPSEAVTRAEKALRPYEFLNWLDDFFLTRQGRRTIDAEESDGESYACWENCNAAYMPREIHKEEPDDVSSSDDSHKISKTFKKVQKRKRAEIAQSIDGNDVLIMNDFHGKRAKNFLEENKEDLFCRSLAADLKDLPPYERCTAKNEISNVVFKYQMAVMNTQHSTRNARFEVSHFNTNRSRSMVSSPFNSDSVNN